MTCAGTGSCNQGRSQCRDGCKPKRTCAELGVCQNRTPPCAADCLPALSRSSHESPVVGPWDWIDELLDRGALVMAAIAIVAVAELATKFFN